MEKEKYLEHIVFEYAEGAYHNPTKEAAITLNLNMWFSPLIEDFNHEKAIIKIFFIKDDKNLMMFEDISEDLKRRAIEEYNKYIIAAGYLPYSL